MRHIYYSPIDTISCPTKSLYICIKEHIEYYEGGLSSDPVDRRNEGVLYHTNKGVRYSTYNLINKDLGRRGNYNEFLEMPDSIYDNIIGWFIEQTNREVKAKDSITFYFYLNELWASGNLGRYSKVKNDSTVSLTQLLKIKDSKYNSLCIKYPIYCRGWKRRNKAFKQLLIKNI